MFFKLPWISQKQIPIMVEVMVDDIINEIADKFHLQKEVEERREIIRYHVKDSSIEELRHHSKKTDELVVNVVSALAASIIIVQCYDLYNELKRGWNKNQFPFTSAYHLYLFLAVLAPQELNGNVFELYKDDKEKLISILSLSISEALMFGEEMFKDHLNNIFGSKKD